MIVQVGVVATRDGTVVSFTIPVSQGVRITYGGITYSDSQTFTVNMNAYQSIVLQNSNDLSGLRIVANYPIAVFSGMRSSRSRLKLEVEGLHLYFL